MGCNNSTLHPICHQQDEETFTSRPFFQKLTGQYEHYKVKISHFGTGKSTIKVSLPEKCQIEAIEANVDKSNGGNWRQGDFYQSGQLYLNA